MDGLANFGRLIGGGYVTDVPSETALGLTDTSSWPKPLWGYAIVFLVKYAAGSTPYILESRWKWAWMLSFSAGSSKNTRGGCILFVISCEKMVNINYIL